MKVCKNIGFSVEIHKLDHVDVGIVGEEGGPNHEYTYNTKMPFLRPFWCHLRKSVKFYNSLL